MVPEAPTLGPGLRAESAEVPLPTTTPKMTAQTTIAAVFTDPSLVLNAGSDCYLPPWMVDDEDPEREVSRACLASTGRSLRSCCTLRACCPLLSLLSSRTCWSSRSSRPTCEGERNGLLWLC